MSELELSIAIEELLVARNPRNMQVARSALQPGYYLRAARYLEGVVGNVIIGTGFPVTDTFETDGPVGAIALYDTLEALGSEPILACGPPLSDSLNHDYRVLRLTAPNLDSRQRGGGQRLHRDRIGKAAFKWVVEMSGQEHRRL